MSHLILDGPVTLLLQGNSFHVLPPLPRCPDLVDLSDNTIDCSCQRLGQEKVDKDVLSKVTVTCNNKMSAVPWRKQHWENPNCTFPKVHGEYKKFDDIYIVKCTGDGFPPPNVSLKHEGKVIVTSVQNLQVIYGLTNYTNVTCEVSNAVGNNESTINDLENETNQCIFPAEKRTLKVTSSLMNMVTYLLGPFFVSFGICFPLLILLDGHIS